MKILGYGEDALTLYVLQKEMGTFLRKVKEEVKEEQADPNRTVVYYRPSFGRRGGAGRSEFGEFDAIVSTDQAIYLVETKWIGSTGFKTRKVKLEERQVIRHKILRWYLEKWREERSPEWQTFAKSHRERFQEAFPKRTMPAGKQDKLVQNLRFILKELGGEKKKIQNVLLLIELCADKLERPNRPQVDGRPDSFCLVHITVGPFEGAGFVQLQS